MSLIDPRDIANNTELYKLGLIGKPIAHAVHRILGMHKINSIYANNKHLKSPAFEKALLSDLNVEYILSDEDIKRIPKEGPFAIVANHPLGGLDGIIMLKAISEVRPDFKIIANFLLEMIEPLKERIFAVNPFESRKDVKNSMRGMKNAYVHIKNGGCLGIFPAGEVSQKTEEGLIRDREWQSPVIKLLQKAQVPIVPMYFHADNSSAFYRLGRLHPDLQTALLPREIFKKREEAVHIRIGKPISYKAYEHLSDVEELKSFLRKKTYILEAGFEKNATMQHVSSCPSVPEEIIEPTSQSLLEKEVDDLRQDGFLFAYNKYEVLFTTKDKSPGLLREISRLREITFRAVGEGTNKAFDTDTYDDYFHHLILWDNETGSIAGAYRMGMGQEIYEKFGATGFYISELFDFDEEMHPILRNSIEMGRAFIVKEHQLRPYPLFLLWQGIIHVCISNPSYKYILGGVSISNDFSSFSKSIMVEFIKKTFYDEKVAAWVHPKIPFDYHLDAEERDFILKEAGDNLTKFDKILEEIESKSLRFPVLIKKYIKQNARVIGFNIDPNFNNVIDGLMYIRIEDIPENTIRPVQEMMEKKGSTV